MQGREANRRRQRQTKYPHGLVPNPPFAHPLTRHPLVGGDGGGGRGGGRERPVALDAPSHAVPSRGLLMPCPEGLDDSLPARSSPMVRPLSAGRQWAWTGMFSPPPPPPQERSLGWCALPAPPFTWTVAPPPGPLARVDPRAGKRSARPGAPPTARPVTVGGWSSLEQHHPCQCNQGVRTAPSRVWSLATPCRWQ